jgi:exopolyphosphatase/guanosine-5'-triphosphate,3'-diphosphate pyrophosphatase
MVKFVREQVSRYVEHIVEEGYDRVIATSGTVLSLGAIALALDRGEVPEEVRNLRVPAKSIKRLRKMAVDMDLEERLRLPGQDPRRADLMVAGAVLTDTLLRELEADEVTLCDLALREGLVLDYINQHRHEIKRVDRYPDVRRRSVIELAERCSYEAEHSRQVGALAMTLFDETRNIHQLGDKEREWLDYASILHDIGNHISYRGHHRHSYYLIKNGDLRGFEPEEIEIIALVARYHRRVTPKPEHDGVRELNKEHRRVVEVLSAFLRVAETLDRSRHGVIRALDARMRLGELRIKVQAAGDAELELWAANRQADVLGQTLGKRVQIEKVPYRRLAPSLLSLVAVNTELTRQKPPRNRRRVG